MVPERFVHLVDDCASVRAIVAPILQDAGFTVLQHSSAATVLATLAGFEGSCIVTDVRMPRIDGLELLTRLRAAGATVPVVVMTAHGDVSTAVRAMKLGACDFIEKPFLPDTLLTAVRGAMSHERPIVAGIGGAIAAERIGKLTRREREVMDLILVGHTHREIGDELAISPRTVEVFRSRIMVKMECETVQDLVRTAIQAGHQ